MIRLDGVTKRFGDDVAVDGASLCVERGEVVALLGPSGCGKTTLLRLIAGFERRTPGSVDGRRPPRRRAGTWIAPEARRVGMVFQDYALFPHLTVAANVGFGLPRRERARRVPELLAIVGLDGPRAALPARALGRPAAARRARSRARPAPELVLLDEPWSNVDPFLRESLRAEVAEIIRPLGVTVLLVTHDREEAFSLADRIALMRDGTIVQEGTAEELYFAPASRWAAEFVGAANVLRDASSPGGSRRRSARSRRTARAAARRRPGARPAGAPRARAEPRRSRGGRRARVPRPRRLLPRPPRRRGARLAAPVDRGRRPRLPRVDPRARRARAGARLSEHDAAQSCVRSALHRG